MGLIIKLEVIKYIAIIMLLDIEWHLLFRLEFTESMDHKQLLVNVNLFDYIKIVQTNNLFVLRTINIRLAMSI